MVIRFLIAAALVCASHPARADDALEQARAHKAALRYAEARAVLDAALRAGGRSPAELAAIYRLLGEVAAGLDDPGEAEEQFKRLLALNPRATLPDGVSPKIKEPFDAAANVIARLGALSVRHEVTADGAVVLVVDSDPLGQVAGARARVRTATGGDSIDVPGKRRITVRLPGGGKHQVVLIALDVHKNYLAVLGSDAVPIEVAPRSSAVDVRPRSSVIASPWLWASVGAGLAAAGVVFGVGSDSAEDDLAELNRESMERPFEIDFSEADDLKRRAERFSLAANISFGAAAAAAVVSAVLLLSGDSVSVTPTVNDNGAGASVAIQF